MDARSVPGPGAGVAWGNNSDGLQALPEGTEARAHQQPAQILSPEQLQRQQGQYQQHPHHHQHHRVQNAEPILQPYPRPPANTPLPETAATLSSERTVERLAHKLSEQKLQLGPPGHDQLRRQPTPPFSTSIPGLTAPKMRSFHRWADSQASGQPRHHFLDALSDDHTASWLPTSLHNSGEPIEVDEEYQEKPSGDDRRLLDVRRPRRQPSGHLGASSGTRPVDPRLETMIASGTQCNVHSEPRPTSKPPRPTTSNATIAALPAFIEPDPDCAMPALEVDLDDADVGGVSGLPADLADEAISLRHASGPGGIRKYAVEGFALRYRLSADVALRCPNVVRSRPRMRRRHKKAGENGESSAATSAVSSPAMSSAGSPCLPPMRLPPQ